MLSCVVLVVQVGLLTACLDYLKAELVDELKAPEAASRAAQLSLHWHPKFNGAGMLGAADEVHM